MVGASLVPATEAVKRRGACGGREVGVSDAEIEDAISRCGGIVGGVFESVESFCLCVCGAAAIFGEGEMLSPPVTEAVTE